MVRIGKLETVLAELAKAVGGDVVYAHKEVPHDEVKAKGRIKVAMKEERRPTRSSYQFAYRQQSQKLRCKDPFFSLHFKA